MERNSLAEKYGARARSLWNAYSNLAQRGPTTLIRSQANAGLVELKDLLARIARAGQDLQVAHPIVQETYRTIALPMIELRLMAMERHLAQLRNPGTTGVFSLNPNKWKMTADEALAYDRKQAETSAYQKQTNPGFFDKISSSISTLAFAGIGFICWKAYSESKKKGHAAKTAA